MSRVTFRVLEDTHGFAPTTASAPATASFVARGDMVVYDGDDFATRRELEGASPLDSRLLLEAAAAAAVRTAKATRTRD